MKQRLIISTLILRRPDKKDITNQLTIWIYSEIITPSIADIFYGRFYSFLYF